MHTPICDELNIEFPIFAFTHCRDVVVAVSKAGGFGVLGAVGFTPEQLEIELKWIDENIGDHPYGVDIVIPNKYEGMDSDMSADELTKTLQRHGSAGARRLRPQDPCPTTACPSRAAAPTHSSCSAGPRRPRRRRSRSRCSTRRCTLIANALGTPPADMIKHIHDEGRKVAALCGSPSQARKHADAGVDIIIAQGGEAGGHCGEVGSIVLWPQVVKEVAPGSRAGRRRDRQRPADRRCAGPRRAGRVDRFAVGDGRGVRAHPGSARRLRQGLQPRHRPQPVLHRQAGPDAAATTGPRRGRTRTTPSRSACRCSTWCPAWPSPPLTSTPNESVDVAFNPDRPGRGSVHQGGEVLGRDRALGAGVPRGDQHAQRDQRGGIGLIRGSTAVQL